MPETVPLSLTAFLDRMRRCTPDRVRSRRPMPTRCCSLRLQEAQSVVRSYDTKAQIVGVGYILALNLVLHFGDLLPTHAPLGPLFFAVVWGIVILADPAVRASALSEPDARGEASFSRRCPVVLNSASTMSIPILRQMSATWFNKP